MVADKDPGSRRRDVLNALHLDAEVLEIEEVGDVPDHLGHHRIQAEGIDVVRGEQEVAQQCRPSVDTEMTCRRHRQIGDVGASVQRAALAPGDGRQPAGEPFDRPQGARFSIVDHPIESSTGMEAAAARFRDLRGGSR